MTDRLNSDLDDTRKLDLVDAELELITSYLNGHLDPERAEAVRRRLAEDGRPRHATDSARSLLARGR